MRNESLEQVLNLFFGPMTLSYRPLSRDVTHDELRIWPPCWRENKKEQKKFLKKIRE